MAAARNRKHIVVPGVPRAEKFTSYGGRRPPRQLLRGIDRPAHGQRLTESLHAAVDEARERRSASTVELEGARLTLYVEFRSRPGVELKLESLEYGPSGIELVSVRASKSPEGLPVQHATIAIPEDKVRHFLKRFESYVKTEPKGKHEKRYENMLDPVADLSLATLRALWTDEDSLYPRDEDAVVWWEAWLRRVDDKELERLRALATSQVFTIGERTLQFADRVVVLVHASARQLAQSIDVVADLAELRQPKETAAFFESLAAVEQAQWVAELRSRTRDPMPGGPAVCLLDTGVNRGHPLLEPAMGRDDVHAVHPNWGTNDHSGHGTEMAGLALYGDLTPVLAARAPVELRHGLESVKILPPSGSNKPDLYGAVTAAAASRVEVQSPTRARCFSMAVTSIDQRDRGRPTSWSASVDALAFGRFFDATPTGLAYIDDAIGPQRLFFISAGNVAPDRIESNHLDQGDCESIHDPAQAWNAVTVGASTHKVEIKDPSSVRGEPLALEGELSPWSTTSHYFERHWPLKPDVLFEGGNVLIKPDGVVERAPIPDLCLLTTNRVPALRAFEITCMTSAATAQVARMAANIAAEYPSLWPESVRALIVHSAEWTGQMHSHLHGTTRKSDRAKFARRYGAGVPSLERSLRSANDALTLIVQSSLTPFDEEGRLGEIHFHELPWPRDVLRGLGSASVRLKVTLSYFIEPNPANRGWKSRYRYASHALRFDIRGPEERDADFRKRLNKLALDEDEERPKSGGDTSDWWLGTIERHRGSIHTDFLESTAAQIAERGAIAIFPATGWWKDQPKRKRKTADQRTARYALVVSIQTKDVETDIWTPVALQVKVPIQIET